MNLSRALSPALLTSAFMIAGAPAGMAPERNRPDRDAAPLSPIISLLLPDAAGNAALRQDAKERAASIAADAKNPYSPAADALQDELDRHLAANPSPFYKQIIVIDPARIDAMRAMGLPAGSALRAFLGAKGYARPADDDISLLAQDLEMHWAAPSGNFVQAVSPASANRPEHGVCLVLPTTPYAPFFNDGIPVPGLDLRVTVDFFDEHEKWHCKDRIYDAREIPVAKTDWKDPGRLLDDPGSMYAMSVHWKKETLADVGALGDMVRKKGHYISLIGHISAFRTGRCAEDKLHCSVPALEALETGILRMGLAGFRAMDDAAAEGFYNGIVERSGLDAPGMRAFLASHYGTERQKAETAKEAEGNPAAARGLGMARYLERSRFFYPERLEAPENLAPVTAWEPSKLLEDTAFAQSGVLSPESLLGAYNAVQADLKIQIDADPAGLLPVEKAAQLRTVFPSIVAGADYSAANAARGVKMPAPGPRL